MKNLRLFPLTVCVVVLLDFPKPECEFSHPVNSSPHPSCGHVHLRRGSAAAETIGLKKSFNKNIDKVENNLKVVVAQVLTIVVTPDVIYVNLTFNIVLKTVFQEYPSVIT